MYARVLHVSFRFLVLESILTKLKFSIFAYENELKWSCMCVLIMGAAEMVHRLEC